MPKLTDYADGAVTHVIGFTVLNALLVRPSSPVDWIVCALAYALGIVIFDRIRQEARRARS